jgi:prepilin-type N-terminal cleavage/methylation domain-containing protein
MDQHLIIEEDKDRGFTLVELLIVIVILGILATVTVFAVRGITDKGQENACKATGMRCRRPSGTTPARTPAIRRAPSSRPPS